jgi:endoglucanase
MFNWISTQYRRLGSRYRWLDSGSRSIGSGYRWLDSRYRQATTPVRVACIAVPVAIAIVAVLVAGVTKPDSSGPAVAQAAPKTPLHAVGAKLVDADGKTVNLTGISWFGFETETYAPHGLQVRNWGSMLDQMRDSGFNTIRLPYSNEMLRPGSKPSGINYNKNPDLKGLSGLKLMDKIVRGATDRGLMVLLDRHRPSAQAQSDLWYTDQVSEQQWIDDWTMLAKHFADDPLVIGADLHNEPKGMATWGTGDARTDWDQAAERAGNAVLQANPNWLIVVEGIESYQKKDYYWWGGNLMAAKEHPVRLSDQSKLVYSAHDYGPGVWKQKWFSAPNFPNNLASIWRKHWAYLQQDGIAPVLMGEFGGRSVSPDTVEGKWQRTLVQFLKDNHISYTYWTWNPNSGDTGGVLKDNWKSIDKAKLDLLKTWQAPQLSTKSLSDKS